jgi:hypothetical protein
MTKHAGRITMTTVGATGLVLTMAQPAFGATTTAAASTTAMEASFGMDPEALLHQLQAGAKIAAAVAVLVVASRLLRGQRRRSWGKAQVELHTGNKLARSTPRRMPALPQAGPVDEMPNWLVTGSHTATRRAWSGSPTGANPVGSMSARTGRPSL